jgi:transposase-like protein
MSRYYKIYGASYFDDMPRNSTYTNQFKTKVVKEYLDDRGSLADLALNYNIKTPSTVCM